MNIEEKMVAQVGTGVSMLAKRLNPSGNWVIGSPRVNSAGMNPQVWKKVIMPRLLPPPSMPNPPTSTSYRNTRVFRPMNRRLITGEVRRRMSASERGINYSWPYDRLLALSGAGYDCSGSLMLYHTHIQHY